jgi:hypothetical protein
LIAAATASSGLSSDFAVDVMLSCCPMGILGTRSSNRNPLRLPFGYH